MTALDNGVPLNDLQAQLGHTDLKTTSIYLKADINHRRKSYEGFNLRRVLCLEAEAATAAIAEVP